MLSKKNNYSTKIICNRFIQQILWIIILLTVWEGIYKLNLFNKQLFPSVFQVFKALTYESIRGELLRQIGYSILIILKGLIIGFLLAMILSCFSYASKSIDSLVDTFVGILNPLPGIAILPLVILWVGIGEDAILLIIVHSIVWPMIINIKTGFFGVDEAYIDTARNNGATFIQLLYYVLVPLSISSILSGLKIGWSRSWRALISSEMIIGAIGAFGGIGWYLLEKRAFMDTSGLYAGIVVIVIIGILMEDFGFRFIQIQIDKRR